MSTECMINILLSSGLNKNRPTLTLSIRRFNFVGVGVTLMEDLCHWRTTLRSQKLKSGPVWHSSPVACPSKCNTFSSFSRTISACAYPCFLL